VATRRTGARNPDRQPSPRRKGPPSVAASTKKKSGAQGRQPSVLTRVRERIEKDKQPTTNVVVPVRISAQLTKIRLAMIKRIKIGGRLHNLDQGSDEYRFSCKTVRAEAEKAVRKHKSKERRITHRDGGYFPLHNNTHPNITFGGCKRCAGNHEGKQDTECDVLKIIRGRRPVDNNVFTSFPCEFCNSAAHSTQACDMMHNICERCKVRGHSIRDHVMLMPGEQGEIQYNLNRSDLEVFRDRFLKLSHIGKFTRLAEGNMSHPWGFDQRGHAGREKHARTTSVDEAGSYQLTNVFSRPPKFPLINVPK
jgi:hypothetical protein